MGYALGRKILICREGSFGDNYLCLEIIQNYLLFVTQDIRNGKIQKA